MIRKQYFALLIDASISMGKEAMKGKRSNEGEERMRQTIALILLSSQQY
jgi:hypothetical protein